MNVPGTLVAIGLYGPRISAAASGFMSHMSMVLGPPSRNRKMHALAFAGVGCGRGRLELEQPRQREPAEQPGGAEANGPTTRHATV